MSIFLLALAATQIYLQPNNPLADDIIVVEATRLVTPLSELAASVSVITKDDLEKLGAPFLVDAFAIVPGVTINQNGSFGGVASVRIRGAKSDQTLVLVDGVPVNDVASPSGGFDFSRLDPSMVERVEILRGAQSTLWGSDAIGGVISIVTKVPEEGRAINLFAEYGSFNTVRGGGEVSGAANRVDYRLAISGIRSDGISKADKAEGNSEVDGYQAYNVAGKIGYDFTDTIRLDGGINYADVTTDTDVFSFFSPGFVADGDAHTVSTELNGHLALKIALFQGRLQNTVLAGYADIERENYAGSSSTFAIKGERSLWRYQGDFSISENQQFVFGAEHEATSVASNDTSTDSYFGLYKISPTERLTLSAGLRRDNHEQFGNSTTGRLSLAFSANDHVAFLANWGQGFKAPTLFQRTFFCCGAVSPNPDLMPEMSDGGDIGLVLTAPDDRGQISISYFMQDTEDLIDFSAGQYLNIAQAKSKGVEIEAHYDFTGALSMNTSFAYIDAINQGGIRINRVPEHSGSISISYDPVAPWQLNVFWRINGDELDGSGKIDAWNRADITGAYTLSDRAEIYGRIENIFDDDYQQILGYGTPGRSGSIGLRLAY